VDQTCPAVIDHGEIWLPASSTKSDSLSPTAHRRGIAWYSADSIMSVAILFAASASGSTSWNSDTPSGRSVRGRFTSGRSGKRPRLPRGALAQIVLVQRAVEDPAAVGLSVVPGRVRQVQRRPLRAVQLGPPLDASPAQACARIPVDERLQRVLDRHQRRITVRVPGTYGDVGPRQRQRLEVTLLGQLVAVVRLPHRPQLVIAGGVAGIPEALDVQPVLVGVHTEPRPVDDQRRDALAELPDHRPRHEPDRLLALVVGVIQADPRRPRGQQARQSVDLGGGLRH
jgi:hypothetical protein